MGSTAPIPTNNDCPNSVSAIAISRPIDKTGRRGHGRLTHD